MKRTRGGHPQRRNALGLDDLATGVHHRRVVDLLARGHHHATTDGVERVRGETGTGGDTPAEEERGEERALERASHDNGLERVVHTEVQTAVDDDADDRRDEAAVKTGDAVRGEGLLVDVDEAVELALTTLVGALRVGGKTGTGVVERVDEEERGGTGSTTRREVTGHPLGVAVTLLVEREERLVVVLEGKVEGLRREVTDDVGRVSTPDCGVTTAGSACDTFQWELPPPFGGIFSTAIESK